MNKVRVFTKSFTDRLFQDSQKTPSLYNTENFIVPDDAYAIGETGLKVEEDILAKVNSTDGSTKDDIENSIRIYEALDINLTTASDPRLWVCLTHTYFYEYMKKRWPLDSPESKSKKSRIKDRYHLRSLSLNNLSRNGISRLWWMAHLTQDLERNDKYELTRVLSSRQDLIAGLLERYLGSNENIRKAILNFLLQNESYLEIEDKRRALLRQINLIGGVKNLPLLDESEILMEIRKIA